MYFNQMRSHNLNQMYLKEVGGKVFFSNPHFVNNSFRLILLYATEYFNSHMFYFCISCKNPIANLYRWERRIRRILRI